jgi:hypothetical protein
VIEQRLGFPAAPRADRELDPARANGVDLSAIRFDGDAEGLIADPDVAIVIELIGGYDAARRLILRSIEAGKHVVTRTRRCSRCTARRSSAPRRARRRRGVRGQRRGAGSRSCARSARASSRTGSRACTGS